jgi:hypothetical protein
MGHSKSHDRGKIQEKFKAKHLARTPHPTSSPDLIPCDFGSLEWPRKKCKIGNFT